jgi:hypothetical protein
MTHLVAGTLRVPSAQAMTRRRLKTVGRSSTPSCNFWTEWNSVLRDRCCFQTKPSSPRAWLSALLLLLIVSPASGAVPAPVASLTARDAAWDDGKNIDLEFPLSPDDKSEESKIDYQLQSSGEFNGLYTDLIRVVADKKDRARGTIRYRVQELTTGEPYWFRVIAKSGTDGTAFAEAGPDAVIPVRQIFDGRRFWLLVITAVICSAVVYYIVLARRGRKFYIRRIAGLDAIEDAVGRATEMGRACLFVPGVNDINEVQTIAGLTILSRVAVKAADYDCELDVPTSRSLVMTAARETLAAAYSMAGRSDAFREDAAYYVTDEQFGYVAHLTGKMVREKPAACFYMGSFFAESLILAETGNAVGAIQIAGTAQPSQLPFFVAACDYTLIGEEFFAASAYLSGDPDQLGTLRGQDFGKIFVAFVMVVGIALSLLAAASGSTVLTDARDFLRNTILGENA